VGITETSSITNFNEISTAALEMRKQEIIYWVHIHHTGKVVLVLTRKHDSYLKGVLLNSRTF
jgi:hypothetical protein